MLEADDLLGACYIYIYIDREREKKSYDPPKSYGLHSFSNGFESCKGSCLRVGSQELVDAESA